MCTVIDIAKKEIRSSFVTPLAYIVIAGFMLVGGFFFFSLLQQFNSILAQAAMMKQITPNLNEWVVMPYFQTLEIILLFLIPVLTMRSIAEERKNGTFEMLITSPISVAQIVWGKFLGLAFVIVVMLLMSFFFCLILIKFADPEVYPIFVGFLGIILFALALSSLGIGISSFTQSQTVAGVVSLVLLLIFFVIDAPAAKLGGPIASFLQYLAPSGHTQNFLKGVIQSEDVIYFLSLMFVGMFVSTRALEAHRWR